MSKFEPCEITTWSLSGEYIYGEHTNEHSHVNFLGHLLSEVCKNCNRSLGDHEFYSGRCIFQEVSPYKAIDKRGIVKTMVPKEEEEEKEERFYKVGDKIRIHTMAMGRRNYIIVPVLREMGDPIKVSLISLSDGNRWTRDFEVGRYDEISEETLRDNIGRDFELIEE